MNQFNKKVILTSKNPEAFLNFRYNQLDQFDKYWIVPLCNDTRDSFNINGIPLNKYSTISINNTLILDSSIDIASFNIYTEKNNTFNSQLYFLVFTDSNIFNNNLIHTYDYSNNTINTYDASNNLINTHINPNSLHHIIDVSILNRPYNLPYNFSPELQTNNNIQVDDITSYMLIRTNPKLTGNIVINIDNSNNMYLDTIKITDTLSNRKYRHQQISSNSILSGDIRTVFSSIPAGELFRVDEQKVFDISIPKTELKYQYNTTYNYGARLLADELYPESYSLFAPLWINQKLPDYFAIFRLSGNHNPETYNNQSLELLANKYLEQSDIIKSWSFKSESALGNYLNRHLLDLKNIQGSLFLSLTNTNLVDAESDPNTWYGIAIDKGILTGRGETPFFFNKNINNLTKLNAFVSDGFERNMLLCPNLLNMQYLFNDNDASLFAMNRYFGLYLTENVLFNVAYYANNIDSSIQILSLDGKDISTFFNSDIFVTEGNVSEKYKNRLLVINDDHKIKKITNINQINDSSINEYLNKPHKNLFSTQIKKVDVNPFMLISLNNRLIEGEHLRIINKRTHEIWEIYGINSDKHLCEPYCSISINNNNVTIYRTHFDIKDDISNQLIEIENAFKRFYEYSDTPFRVAIRKNNWLSIILNSDTDQNDWCFQRITGTLLRFNNTPTINRMASPNDISFFGIYTPSINDFETLNIDSFYGPIDFEFFGSRQSITIDFLITNDHYYSFVNDQNILDKFENIMLYQSANDRWYRRLLNFNISTNFINNDNVFQYVKDPTSFEDKILISTQYEIQTINGVYNAYNIQPIKISLMGINPVKDIDYTVYDQSIGFKSEYTHKREHDISTYILSINPLESYTLDIPGSFVIKTGEGVLKNVDGSINYKPNDVFNTFDSSIHISTTTYSEITYAVLDGSHNFRGYKDGSAGNEENLSDYYYSNTRLKHALTIPEVVKWVGLGSDCRNNPMRLILDSSILDISTNFIPTENTFSQEISIPSFKYLDPTQKNWKSYIFYDVNDTILYNNEHLTFKDLIFKYPYVDYFSKICYLNYGVNTTHTRSSIVHYNQYKNTIDTIFMGLSLSFSVRDIAKNIINIKNYDKYRFSFISTTSRNKTNKKPIEFIINENTKTILMIWYQGNDELNHNMRYSSFLPGKSLLDPTNNGFISEKNKPQYSFVKTPFVVRNDTITKNVERFYDPSFIYDSSTVRPYAQINKKRSGNISIWNAFGNNNILDMMFNTDHSKMFQTFFQKVDYEYVPSDETYNDYTLNYGYNYDNNTNWYVNNTCNFNTLKFHISPTQNNVMYYIIRENNIYNNHNFGSSLTSPMMININPAQTFNNITLYNGWFKPKFNTILEFKPSETQELSNLLKNDFILSNTNLYSYNGIPQLWYNKVTNTITNTDISTGNAISFKKDFNVFKSLWDKDYYTLNENNENISVNGYVSPYEMPTFFGSKLPKLPKVLNLDSWNNTTSMYSITTNEITLSFNLTQSIMNLFIGNTSFTQNWGSFVNIGDAIVNYITHTILPYYNISQSKIKVNFFYKSRDTNILHHRSNSNFIIDNKQNFNGQLLYENDEYIYKIIIPNDGKFSYYVSFNLFEK